MGRSAEQVASRLDRVVARVRGSGVDQAICFGHGHALRALTMRWLGLRLELGRALPAGHQHRVGAGRGPRGTRPRTVERPAVGRAKSQGRRGRNGLEDDRRIWALESPGCGLRSETPRTAYLRQAYGAWSERGCSTPADPGPACRGNEPSVGWCPRGVPTLQCRGG